MTKQEFIQQAALILLQHEYGESVDYLTDYIKNYADGVYELCEQQEEKNPEEQGTATEEPVTIEEVDDAVSSIRLSNCQTKRAIANALYFCNQYVGKDCAANLSRFYGGVTVKQTQEAIESGEIEAIIPEMQEVEISRWNPRQQRHERAKAMRPTGKYQISLKSTILWLERNGHRGVAEYNPVYKCIEKIINS